jgi:hypothetical protein
MGKQPGSDASVTSFLRRPEDWVVVQRFPRDMRPMKMVSVELGDVKKSVLKIDGLALRRGKSAKVKRQTRYSLLEMEFSQSVVARELRLNMSTSEVLLIGQVASPLVLTTQVLTPSSSNLTTFFKREDGKKKILHAFFYGSGQSFVNIDRALESYDRILCVDTNTGVSLGGQRFSVTTAIAGKLKKIGQIAAQLESDLTVQVVDKDPAPGNAELHGIAKVISHLNHNVPRALDGRVAIITDTEFGRIKAWSRRTEPFYNGHNLPEGVDILYATADSGSDEYLANKMMRTCDVESTKKLREVLATASTG